MRSGNCGLAAETRESSCWKMDNREDDDDDDDDDVDDDDDGSGVEAVVVVVDMVGPDAATAPDDGVLPCSR